MYERLEIEPRNSHERVSFQLYAFFLTIFFLHFIVYIFFQDLVCGNVESLQLSSETMTAVKDLLQNLEFEMNTNNETAKEVIEKMRGIAEKLKMPFDLASLQREFYSTKMINSVSIITYTIWSQSFTDLIICQDKKIVSSFSRCFDVNCSIKPKLEE